MLRSPRQHSIALALSVAALSLACGGDGHGTAPPAPVARVVVSGAPTGPTLVGNSFQLTASPEDEHGTALPDRPVTWSSSDALVATVTTAGLVSAVGPGRATISAASGGQTGSAAFDFRVGGALGVDGGTIAVLGGAFTLSVPNGALAQAAVIMVQPTSPVPSDPRIADGKAYQLSPDALTFARPASLTLKYDRSRLPTGLSEASLLVGVLTGGAWAPVAGSTADPSSASVTGAIAHAGIYAVLSANVDHVVLLGAPALGRLYVGQSAQLTSVPYDAANNPLAGRPVTWLSSNTTAVTVSGTGRVTAIAPGSATITVTIEGKSASTTIESLLVPVSTVTVVPQAFAIYAGQHVQLVATLKDSAGGVLSGRTVTWTSSAEQTASVDAGGTVTGVAGGTATITATSEGKSGTARITVLPKVVADWSQAAEWTTYQGNASHTGFVVATVDPLVFRELWVTSPLGAGALNPVTAGDGNVMVSTVAYFGKQLLAVLDASTGVAKWSYDFGGIHSVDPPAYDNGTVYVQTGGHGDSFLWGFDANTGVIRFRSAYENQWSTYYAPVIVGQTVYFAGGYYGGMYAYSATDGAKKWFAQLNQYDQFTPAVRDGLVYAYTGDYSPKVTVVNATTGAVAYEIPDPHFSWNGWSMNVSPVLGDANDLLATQGGRLISFDLTGRQVKWEQTSNFSGNVTAAGGMLYVVNSGQIEARRESDGTLAWLWIPPDGAPFGTTIVTNNLLFVSTAANTYAIDLASHIPVWSYHAGGFLALSKQGLLLIAQQNGKIAAIKVQ